MSKILTHIFTHIFSHWEFIPYTFAIGIFFALVTSAIPKQEREAKNGNC